MKRGMLIVGSVGAALALFVMVCFFAAQPVNRWLMVRRGNHVVAQIESFRQTHGRIPERLGDVGVNDSESGPWFYKHTDQRYLLWFSEGFDMWYGYQSASKRWTEFPTEVE